MLAQQECALLLLIRSFSRLMSLLWLVLLPLSPSLPGWSPLSLHYLSPSSWLDGPAGWLLPFPSPLVHGSTCWLAPPPYPFLPSGSEGKGGGERWVGGQLVEREYSCPSLLPIVMIRAGKIWSPTLLSLSSVTLPLPLSPAKVWRPLGLLECVPGSPVKGPNTSKT